MVSILEKKYAIDIPNDTLFETLKNSSVDVISSNVYKTLYRDENLSKLVSSLDLKELKYKYLDNKTVQKLVSKSKKGNLHHFIQIG